MVQVADIVVLRESVDLGVDPGDTATFRGIHAEWKGNAWQITALDANAPQGLRRGQSVPRQYTGGLVNTVRQSKGLERLRFDGAGNVVQSPRPQTTPTSTPAAEKPPVEMDDLSRGQRNQLSRHGRVTIAGHTYTRQEINDFTDAARIRRSQSARDARATLLNLEGQDTRSALRRNIEFLTRNGWRGLKSILPFTYSPGVSTGAWMALTENLLELNSYAENELRGREQQEVREYYQTALKRILAVWFWGYFFPDIIRTLMRSPRIIVGIFKTLARTANFAIMALRQGISAVTPATFLGSAAVNAVQWILVEAALGVATYYALRSSYIKSLILAQAQKDAFSFLENYGYNGAEALNQMVTEGWNEHVAPILGDGWDFDEKEIIQRATDLPLGLDRDMEDRGTTINPKTGEDADIPTVDPGTNTSRRAPTADEVFR